MAKTLSFHIDQQGVCLEVIDAKQWLGDINKGESPGEMTGANTPYVLMELALTVVRESPCLPERVWTPDRGKMLISAPVSSGNRRPEWQSQA